MEAQGNMTQIMEVVWHKSVLIKLMRGLTYYITLITSTSSIADQSNTQSSIVESAGAKCVHESACRLTEIYKRIGQFEARKRGNALELWNTADKIIFRGLKEFFLVSGIHLHDCGIE
jgi:hypothetical protein